MKCQTCVNNGGKSTLTLVHNYCYKTPAKFDEDGKRIDDGYHQICIWKCSSGHDMYTQGYDHEGYTVITQNEFERQVAIDHPIPDRVVTNHVVKRCDILPRNRWGSRELN
jgi:hypothetical protein